MAVSDLKSLKHVHIIGVCGTLMGAFAAFLKRAGVEVTGSDQSVYPPMSEVLRSAGVRLHEGYKAENLMATGRRPDLVVVGNVIRADNPEARAAIDGGYEYSSLPEAMERFMLGKTRNIVVAGTHGKTTTSTLLAHVLNSCGTDPSYFIGGVPHDLPFSFNVTSVEAGAYFVLEGDEYDTAFWDKVPKFNHYLPDDAILTSVEFDHADIYADLGAVQKAFEGLVVRIRKGPGGAGRLICCYDYPGVVTLAEGLARSRALNVISYASEGNPTARFIPRNLRSVDGRLSFEVVEKGRTVDEIVLQVPGHHNVLNALAVWIECRELGLSPDKVRAALASFRGVKRRQEVRGEIGGVMVIDDFAHHPTAVKETLRALRIRYPGRRLIAVFEPRSATSRRKIFQKEYAQAFTEADATFIAVPYDQSRIPVQDQFSSDELVTDVERAGKSAYMMASVDAGVERIVKFAEQGDVVAVLSNGGFGGFIGKLLKALETDRKN